MRISLNMSAHATAISKGLLVLLASHWLAVSSFADPPLAIDDAPTIPVGLFEFEAGVRYAADGPTTHYDFPFALTYGVLPRLDLSVGLGGQLEERQDTLRSQKIITGLNDFTAAAKAQLLTAERDWADQSVTFGLKLPTADRARGLGSGCADLDVTWILSKPFLERWGAHLNLGHTWVGREHDRELRNLLHYGVAVDFQWTRSVQLVAEAYANTPLKAEHETNVLLNGGLRWSVTQSLILDAAVGGGVRGQAPEVLGRLGFMWKFGPGRSD